MNTLFNYLRFYIFTFFIINKLEAEDNSGITTAYL